MSVSNDQSPPARKVIPYKKGGPRKSPFAEMAFQFTGTALDVAIQQREQESQDSSAKTLLSETPEGERVSVKDLDAEPQTAQADERASSEPPQPPSRVEAPKPRSSPPTAGAPNLQRVKTKRDVGPVPVKKKRAEAADEPPPQMLAFITRWRPFLTETQLAICTHIYQNSIAVGQEYCFTSTAKLMAAVSKTERQVQTVINQLIDWGFLVKGETIVNSPRDNRGTNYRLIIDKS